MRDLETLGAASSLLLQFRFAIHCLCRRGRKGWTLIVLDLSTQASLAFFAGEWGAVERSLCLLSFRLLRLLRPLAADLSLALASALDRLSRAPAAPSFPIHPPLEKGTGPRLMDRVEAARGVVGRAAAGAAEAALLSPPFKLVQRSLAKLLQVAQHWHLAWTRGSRFTSHALHLGIPRRAMLQSGVRDRAVAPVGQV